MSLPTHRLIPVLPLTREAFAPFGHVIAAEGAPHYPINLGSTQRYHALAPVDVEAGGGRGIISIFRAQPTPQPVILRVMERHPLGSQAFVPLGGEPFLIVVAPPGPAPEPDALRAFITDGHQGASYAPGTWHHPVLALEQVTDFLIVDRTGPGDNCDEVPFDLSAAPRLDWPPGARSPKR